MNFVFISPNFPRTYWMFCDRLRKNGFVYEETHNCAGIFVFLFSHFRQFTNSVNQFNISQFLECETCWQ